MSSYLSEPLNDASSEAEKIASDGPGMYLRKMREAAGLTRLDAASRLHLRVTVIEAIEEDDYKKIPRLVFARGYLRAYAKFLGASGDEIVARFNQLGYIEKKPEYAPPSGQKPRRPPREGRPFGLGLSLSGVILLFIGVGAWHYSHHESPPESSAEILADAAKPAAAASARAVPKKKPQEPLEVSPASATPLDELKSVSRTRGE